MESDGIVGKATWYKISSIYTAVARLAELDSEGNTLGIGTVPPSVTLRQGSMGQDVITLQYLLKDISEFYPSIPNIAQDGIFGSGTRQAVIAFQNELQLSPDGIVGVRTWSALYDTYLGIKENITSPGNEVFAYTVWLLARRFQTTVNAIMSQNGLTSDLLNIGQILLIPKHA